MSYLLDGELVSRPSQPIHESNAEQQLHDRPRVRSLFEFVDGIIVGIKVILPPASTLYTCTLNL